MEPSPSRPGTAPVSLSGGASALSIGGQTSTSPRGGVPLSVPLPFLLAGVCGAALFGVLLPWVAPDAARAPDFPHVLALVHTATLGWLTMIIMGATYQLVPVILVTPLRAGGLIRAMDGGGTGVNVKLQYFGLSILTESRAVVSFKYVMPDPFKAGVMRGLRGATPIEKRTGLCRYES